MVFKSTGTHVIANPVGIRCCIIFFATVQAMFGSSKWPRTGRSHTDPRVVLRYHLAISLLQRLCAVSRSYILLSLAGKEALQTMWYACGPPKGVMELFPVILLNNLSLNQVLYRDIGVNHDCTNNMQPDFPHLSTAALTIHTRCIAYKHTGFRFRVPPMLSSNLI